MTIARPAVRPPAPAPGPAAGARPPPRREPGGVTLNRGNHSNTDTTTNT